MRKSGRKNKNKIQPTSTGSNEKVYCFDFQKSVIKYTTLTS